MGCAGRVSADVGVREDEAMMVAAEWVKSQKESLLRFLGEMDITLKNNLCPLNFFTFCAPTKLQ